MKNKHSNLRNGVEYAKGVDYLPTKQSYEIYETMKKEYTGFRTTTTGKDFLEIQHGIVILTHLLYTYKDGKTCPIKKVSMQHLKDLKNKLKDKFRILSVYSTPFAESALEAKVVGNKSAGNKP